MGEAPQRGAGRFVAVAVVLFLAAVALGRFLIDRNDLWPLFLLALPLVLVGLSFALGFVRALILVGFFACAVLAFRWILSWNAGGGWMLVLLSPVVALAALLAIRVVRALVTDRQGRAGAALPRDEKPD